MFQKEKNLKKYRFIFRLKKINKHKKVFDFFEHFQPFPGRASSGLTRWTETLPSFSAQCAPLTARYLSEVVPCSGSMWVQFTALRALPPPPVRRTRIRRALRLEPSLTAAAPSPLRRVTSPSQVSPAVAAASRVRDADAPV